MENVKKLSTGKFKPTCDKATFALNLVVDLCLISLTSLFIFGVLNFPSINFSILLILGILIPLMDYMILLSPYQQYTENYYIELENENKIEGFKLFYRKKEIKVLYEINESGKLSFCDKNPLKCFSYADGTKISFLTKQRIANYFIAWLGNNGLIE